MIKASRVLAGIPTALRETLLSSYQLILSNYGERRWEPSELNGGKFCEAVYSIIAGALSNNFPAKACKPANMYDACRTLEQTPSNQNRVGDRSLRVLIPRVLPVLYEIRNQRGVGHIGGEVDPNHMDAEAVQSMASWVMAELVRVFHGVTVQEAQETVDALVERKTPLIWEVEGVRRVLVPGMSAKNKVLLLLHHSTGWVSVAELFGWVEYSNLSMFRRAVLIALHKDKLIEFNQSDEKVRISPLGSVEVETKILSDEEPRSKSAAPKRKKPRVRITAREARGTISRLA